MRLTVNTLVLLIAAVNARRHTPRQTECDYYETEGITSAYYTHHRFYDFRYLQNQNGTYNNEPANVTDDTETSVLPVQAGYLASAAFIDDWGIQTWASPAGPNRPVKMQYSNQNIWIQRDNPNDPKSTTHLTLRTYHNEHFSSTAEMDHKQQGIFHASIRVRARVRGDAGACAGIFTYLNDTNESDIEILTRDPKTHIRYTNQPGLDENGNEVPEASSDVELKNGAVWTDWNDHRLDWTPELSAWYVNDELAVTKTYGVPKSPSSFILNIWNDGGVWTGKMDAGAAAYLEIQWIEMVYNVSSDSTTTTASPFRRRCSECSTVCRVDGVRRAGSPERMF